MDQCAECGAKLTPDRPNVPRVACSCGSTIRLLSRTTHESLKTGGSLSWNQRRPGTHAHGYLDDRGNVTSVAEKPTPENEQDGQAICERLVNWLNRSGPLYGEPVAGGSEEIDWLAPALHGDGENLLMQVVRAEMDEEFWRRVAQAGQARREITVAEAADLLINAVRHKKHYPVPVRAKLVLVVDSGRSPGYTFQPVMDTFKTKYATECAESGYRSVYVVGPNSELVYRVAELELVRRKRRLVGSSFT
jgi:hypothetical protein